ncbi:hypothetical protein BOX15_Mlig015422g1, partial [Macrostomum lignano]
PIHHKVTFRRVPNKKTAKNASNMSQRLSAFGIVSMLVLIVAVAAASQSRPAYYLASQSQPANPAESSLDDGTAAVAACRFAVDARVCRLDAASLEALRRLHDWQRTSDREELSQVHSFERVYSGSDAAGRSPADTAAAAAFGSRKGGGGKGNALDLWRAWRASEMHNWTVEEVCSWLSAHASLGQLVPLARELGIDGPHLPLLTELSPHPSVAPLAQALSPTEKRKLTIRATDLVLFGPPGRAHNPLKDFLTVLCLLASLGGAWTVWAQLRLTDRQRRRVFAELDSLHHAERSLGDLQEKLSRSEQQRELDRAERLRLQDIYQKEIDSLKAEAGRLSSQRLNTTETDLAEKLRLAEQEVCQLRAALETESQRRPAAAAVSPELWTLLQLTWESELRYCRQNWQQAELRLAKASEGLERLRRKQNSAIGVLRGAFNSAEMVGTFEMSIAEAKEFADKVKLDVSERMQRWARIEELLGVEMQQPSRGVAVTQRAAEAPKSAVSAAATAVGGAVLRHRATVPAHLARPISSAALRLLDSDIDMQQPRQAAGRRRSSARPADALPAACGSGLTWPKTSAAALAAAAGSEATADASGSPQLQPSGAASAHSFETGSDLLLRSCGQRPEQLLAVAQFHVPDGYADVDSPRVSPERQQSQPVGPEAVSSRAASLISAAPSSPSDAGDASVGARKSKAAAGSKLAKLRALSIFAGRSARRRSKNK